MKTKSIWGRPPTRLYNLIKMAENTFNRKFTACVVGCSDGKFILPFARKGHETTGYEVDKSALYGGTKLFPIRRPNYAKIDYQERTFPGVHERIQIEELEHVTHIEERDFYKNTPDKQFDVVFTSCSLHYTLNSGFTLADKTQKLQSIVAPGGFLYIDYMLAIDDKDFEAFPQNKFYRTSEITNYFDPQQWHIVSYRENKKPTLEPAHVECPFDHYHRFGYICVQKIRG